MKILAAKHITLLMNGHTRKGLPSNPECLWAQGFMASFLKQRNLDPDAWWDIHQDVTWTGHKSWNPHYTTWLASRAQPIVMFNKQPSIPTSIGLPDEVKKLRGQEPFAGTIDWMVATAIHLGAEKISLYGVDYTSAHERLYQTFGLAYWIGKARGLGIEVELPPNCPVLWNILSGDYGPDFPPWPTEHDPRGWLFHKSDLNAYVCHALDRWAKPVEAKICYPVVEREA